MAVSPDGTRLASGSTEGTVILWDSTALERLEPRPLTAEELRRDWASLNSAAAAIAYPAMYRLASAPAEAVPMLHDQLRALAPGAAAQIVEW